MIITKKRATTLLFYLLAIVALDIFTKYLTKESIPMSTWSSQLYPYGGIPVFKGFMGIDFSINHAVNRGGPWGVASSYHHFLVAIRIVAILCIVGHLLFFNDHVQRQVPLVLILSGAIGNVLDSFFYGHVIDMFHFVFWGYSFPVFNIADMSIFFGVFSILAISVYQKIKASREINTSSEL